MIIRYIVFFLLIVTSANTSFCQDADSLIQSSSKKDIKLCYVRPTFLQFSVRTLPAINNYPNGDKQQNSDYRNNKSYNIKLNFPILSSNKFDIIGQLRYKNEQLHLGTEINSKEKEIHFDNMGFSFLMKYKLNTSYYIAGHASGFLKADKVNFENYASILDYSGSILVGKNFDNGEFGLGALIGNSLGRFRIYPIVLLDYQFSDTWKIEMKLPKEIQIRKIIKPDNFYLVGGMEINGSSYFISEDIYHGEENLEYRRAAIDFRLGLEKEIYDFLWFGVDFGVSQPIYSALIQSGEPTRNKLFDFNHSFAPYGSISIFIVPPRALFNKKR